MSSYSLSGFCLTLLLRVDVLFCKSLSNLHKIEKIQTWLKSRLCVMHVEDE